MTITSKAIVTRWVGLSTDDKPRVDVTVGSTFEESDTGETYQWDGLDWCLQISDTQINYDASTVDLMNEIVGQLKITNAHLESLTSEHILQE